MPSQQQYDCSITRRENAADCARLEKQIKISAVAESKKKLKRKMETNNYIVIYSGVNRSVEHK
jgi:hypothetical protein